METVVDIESNGGEWDEQSMQHHTCQLFIQTDDKNARNLRSLAIYMVLRLSVFFHGVGCYVNHSSTYLVVPIYAQCLGDGDILPLVLARLQINAADEER